MPLEDRLPLLVTTLHFHAIHSQSTPWILPQTWTAERDDRIISVEDQPITFVGIALRPAGLWAGTADIRNARVTITCQGPTAPTALRVCTDLGLPR